MDFIDCNRSCLLCTQLQSFTVNFSDLHGVCKDHQLEPGEQVLCTHCQLPVCIIDIRGLEPVQCQRCSGLTAHYFRWCNHVYCDSCSKVLQYWCNACDQANQSVLSSAPVETKANSSLRSSVLSIGVLNTLNNILRHLDEWVEDTLQILLRQLSEDSRAKDLTVQVHVFQVCIVCGVSTKEYSLECGLHGTCAECVLCSDCPACSEAVCSVCQKLVGRATLNNCHQICEGCCLGEDRCPVCSEFVSITCVNCFAPACQSYQKTWLLCTKCKTKFCGICEKPKGTFHRSHSCKLQPDRAEGNAWRIQQLNSVLQLKGTVLALCDQCKGLIVYSNGTVKHKCKRKKSK